MKTIREIKQELQNADVSSRESLLEQYRTDTRSGVAALVRKYEREAEKLEQEKQRIETLKVYEKKYEDLGD